MVSGGAPSSEVLMTMPAGHPTGKEGAVERRGRTLLSRKVRAVTSSGVHVNGHTDRVFLHSVPLDRAGVAGMSDGGSLASIA
jgi:hypothetical protein